MHIAPLTRRVDYADADADAKMVFGFYASPTHRVDYADVKMVFGFYASPTHRGDYTNTGV